MIGGRAGVAAAGPDGALALRHRKLVPTNHERLVWGPGDGSGLDTVDVGGALAGGLICWENLMPLARFALYERGVEIYLAPTAEDSEGWLASMRHIARESRAYVLSCCAFQRASSYPDDVPLAPGDDLLGRGGSAIYAPGGDLLAGPLWDEEGILYADLDPTVLYAARQRFDPARGRGWRRHGALARAAAELVDGVVVGSRAVEAAERGASELAALVSELRAGLDA